VVVQKKENVISNIEFLPTWVLFIPQFILLLWYAITRLRITYFTTANPGIYLSGLYDESKNEILNLIPTQLVPKTLFLLGTIPANAKFNEIEKAQFIYPLICKPDAGGRGVGVAKIENKNSLIDYLKECNSNLLVQEFIHLPNEAGIFFCASPTGKFFEITSLTLKTFLTVTGNGTSTVAALLKEIPRGAKQLDRLRIENQELLISIPKMGKNILIEPIGNHIRGTEFIDGKEFISAKMVASFKSIVSQIPGIYYGRFDVKFKDMESLENGIFSVLELNGLTSEPTHIYDPHYTLIKAWKSVWYHTAKMMKIAGENQKLGAKPASVKEVWHCLYQHFK